ncbi:MAG TPA: EAL domain-containing protein [Methylotenera sp.]|nr:EAL domain-containing protein [Methylotenera sp.]
MSHSLGLKVIAEGVETAEQLEFLIANSCDHYQGYYFSKPLPIADFEALLSKLA